MAVVGLIFTTSTDSKIYAFEIIPLDIGSSNITLPDINCNIKSTVNGLDVNGNIVLTEQSSFFEKHPRTTFSLVGGIDNSVVVSFDIQNKMRCDFINNAPFVPMTAVSSELKVVIYAKDQSGVEKEVWNNLVRVNVGVPIVNNTEEQLSEVNARTSDIHKYLPDGNYKTTLRFVTYGTVTLQYDVDQFAKYDVVIPDNKIVTFIDLDVQKTGTAGGDGEPQKEPEPTPKSCESTNSCVPEITDIIQEFSLCASAFDINCLMQSQFLPYYVGGFGAVFLIGAVTTRNSRMSFDQFGNPQ